MLTAAQNGAIEVFASRYGGFEQVGSLPQSFSRSDAQMTTQQGDIVLYSGNQLVIFFGSNSWSYTRLGHIEGLFTDELTALLDKDVAFIEIKKAKIAIDHKGLGLSQNCRVSGQRLCLLFSQISISADHDDPAFSKAGSFFFSDT